MPTGANQLLDTTAPSHGVAVPGVSLSSGSRVMVRHACRSALAASDSYAATEPVQRADLLDRIADNIETLGRQLAGMIAADTGLTPGQAAAEIAATVGQLRFFGDLVRSGNWLGLRIDRTKRASSSLALPDIRQRNIAIGPVAIFGTDGVSPVFSMIGDGTASALAAGCPVVAVAPPAYPETARLVASAVKNAIAESGLHEDVFTMLHGAEGEFDAHVATDHRIEAVVVTGSRADAHALNRIAASRREPIPVYSTECRFRPLIVLPAALAARGDAIGSEFATSMQARPGRPAVRGGVALALDGPGRDGFLTALASRLGMTMPSAPATRQADMDRWETVARFLQFPPEELPEKTGGAAAYDVCILSPDAFGVSTQTPSLARNETATIVIFCVDLIALQKMIAALGAQSAIILQMDSDDIDLARALLPRLERKTDRIGVNSFARHQETSREFAALPFSAPLDPRGISSGNLAIARFLRPVSYQDVPDALLPDQLKDASCLWADMPYCCSPDFSAYIVEHAKRKDLAE